MGKEQELLEAARTGNSQAVKTILSGRQARSGSGSGGLTGGLRSLLALKQVSISCKDPSGYTPLHLSALNGHREVVQALLAARAMVTEVDCKGCTPLHLAAWNGHADICEILLTQAADKSIVNAQTNEGETPLHFASQHGHLNVVSLLLKNKADPSCRTLAERSALDLAAQYGKTDVVRTLVNGRHELLNHVAGQPSPLHLAAFNGHLHIVGFLLDSGFPVNTRTDNGTALHEAATSCKLDVIKLLLDRGVDVWAKAKNSMTAEDILKSINSRLTQEALQIINGHVNSQRTPDSDGEKDVNGIPGPGRAAPGEATPPGRPIPKPRSVFSEGVEPVQFKDSASHSSPCEPQSPPPPIPPRISLRSVEEPLPDFLHVVDPGQLLADSEPGPSRSRDTSPMSGGREQPKKPPRKTPSMRKTEAPQRSAGGASGGEPSTATQDKPRPQLETDPCQTGDVKLDVGISGTAAEDVKSNMAETVGEDCASSASRKDSDSTEAEWAERGRGRGEVQGGQGEGSLLTVTAPTKRESIYANTAIVAAESDMGTLPCPSLHAGEETSRETSEDLSHDPPSQSPAPDYPPPSPITADEGLQDTVCPEDQYSQGERVTESGGQQLTVSAASLPASHDMEGGRRETTTALAEGVTAHDPPAGTSGHPLPSGQTPVPKERKTSITSSTRGSSSSTPTLTPTPSTSSSEGVGVGSTVEVEGEVVELRRSVSDWDSNVFAGLLKGSTPGGSRNVVSQICENVVVKTVRSKHRSTPSTIVTFDPLMEREEDRDVFDADRVLDEIEEMTVSGAGRANHQQGEGDPAGKSDDLFDDSEEWAKIAATLKTFGVGMARESVFVKEYEASFTKSLAGSHHKIQSVGEWLDSLGLGQYENTLVANGFDDTDFLGGSIIEDQDLTAIGISNKDHRTAIVAAAQRLLPVQPIDQMILPESVEKWLNSLRLGQYLDTFVSHKYNTMLRVIKLWEFELNTVLDISSLGHRKRILASLGDRLQLEREPSVSPARVRRRESEENEPRSPFEHINLYVDYTGVKAQGTGSEDPRSPRHPFQAASNPCEENGPGSPQVTRDTQIHIRPPHLMHTTGSIKQWRHRPEVLIKGCCNYTAHYLGSTVVKELKGTTSTKEGIAKLKKSTDVISKIPTIMLSISYKGVKFIDAKSKRVICDHEIANIFCACQDADHMNFFAYVTKDKETSRHYCHVFSVRSREQAGEIILTLGEAFEIAYQMALKERKEEELMQLERQLSQSDQDDVTSVSSIASVSTV